METLLEAKEYLRANWEKGVTCPCCKQSVKKYRRAIHSSMCLALINLYKISKGGKEYHHISDFVGNFGDFSKFRYWGLVEEKEKEDGEDKRTSGYWKITEKGIAFVLGEVKVKSHILIFNKKVYGFDGNDVTIQELLKKKFSYEELMNG